MTFVEGDVVRVISVSGHDDISDAIGQLGQVACVSRHDLIYRYQVKYLFPIECKCASNCGNFWFQEFFKEDELEAWKDLSSGDISKAGVTK